MGVLEGCSAFLKYIFFFFTFVLWLLGVTSIGIGIWAKVDSQFTEILTKWNIPGLDESALASASTLLIIVGVLIMVIGFLGCCGAMKENQLFLGLFFFLLFLIFCLMIAGAVMAYAYRGEIEKLVKNGVDKLKDSYDTLPDSKTALDAIQKQLGCCAFVNGMNNGTKVESCFNSPSTTPVTKAPTKAPGTKAPVTKAPVTTAPVTKAPVTKAPAEVTTAAEKPTAPTPAVTTGTGRRKRAASPGNGLNTKNCATELMKEFETLLDSYKVKIGGIGVASALILVLGMIVSLALCCKIRNSYNPV